MIHYIEYKFDEGLHCYKCTSHTDIAYGDSTPHATYYTLRNAYYRLHATCDIDMPHAIQFMRHAI